MAWHERDYSIEDDRGTVLQRLGLGHPPRGVIVLIALHITALLLVAMLLADAHGAIAGRIALGAAGHWVAIALHPLATRNPLDLLFTVILLWTLGARVERSRGAGRLVLLYAAGNLALGAVAFGIAAAAPALGRGELAYPLGAALAWLVGAWRELHDERRELLGKMLSMAQLFAVVLGLSLLIFALRHLDGATAVLAGAAAAGGAGWLAARPWPTRNVRAAPVQRRRAVRPSPVSPASESVSPVAPARPDIDDILAKISREGLLALTAEERARLEAARRELRQ